MDVGRSELEPEAASSQTAGTGIFFDGTSSRRRMVTLVLGDRLEFNHAGQALGSWDYDDLRRADAPAGVFRVSCAAAPALARLETRDREFAAQVISRCTRLDENRLGGRGVAGIVGWSLAAAISLVLIVLFGLPFAADRLAPLVPQRLEARLGEVAEAQVRQLFGGRICAQGAGQAAFVKLVGSVLKASEIDSSVQIAVLNNPVPNAFAFPGARIYLLSGLLARAENPDEIAGVLAHEIAHLRHRDSIRNLIYEGGTSFLIGVLFGDVTGSGALIFVSRSMVTASYSRDAEQGADAFSMEVMHRLGRSAKAMGELMLRVTGKQVDNSLSLLSSHPLTEDRLAEMRRQDRPISGPPLLTTQEWRSLKAICGANPQR